jgi:hypothetical protein
VDGNNLSAKAKRFLSESFKSNLAATLELGGRYLETLLPTANLRKQRSSKSWSTAEDVSLTALTYVDMFLRVAGSREKPDCVALNFCLASKSGKMLGDLTLMLSDHLSDFAAELLVPEYRIDPGFLRNVTRLARKDDFNCERAFSDC